MEEKIKSKILDTEQLEQKTSENYLLKKISRKQLKTISLGLIIIFVVLFILIFSAITGYKTTQNVSHLSSLNTKTHGVSVNQNPTPKLLKPTTQLSTLSAQIYPDTNIGMNVYEDKVSGISFKFPLDWQYEYDKNPEEFEELVLYPKSNSPNFAVIFGTDLVDIELSLCSNINSEKTPVTFPVPVEGAYVSGGIQSCSCYLSDAGINPNYGEHLASLVYGKNICPNYSGSASYYQGYQIVTFPTKQFMLLDNNKNFQTDEMQKFLEVVDSFTYKGKPQSENCGGMPLAKAIIIALNSLGTTQGLLSSPYSCTKSDKGYSWIIGYWPGWPNLLKRGCTAAFVVDVANETTKINWQCNDTSTSTP